jgi:hypothetical protein
MKVDAVSYAQQKSQHSKNVASYDKKKSHVVVCNTECAPQDTGTHQENLSGKSGGSLTKENTIRATGTLVSEGNALELRDASVNSVFDNSTVQPNTDGNRTYQELQIRLTRCDSLVRLSRSSGSESHLNIVSGEGTESELNVPACHDSAQEMLDDDKANEKQSKRNHVSHGKQTVLNKEGKINAKSVGGENEGKMVNYHIHESLLDKWEEEQWISSRHILKICSVVEKLSCDGSQDKEMSEKSSSELDLGESDKQSLLKNCYSNHKVTVYPEMKFSDKNALTRSLSQISCFDGSESDSNSSNGEDITPGRNGHNILKLKRNIADHRNDTYHDVLFTRPDPTVSKSRVSYLPSEKKIPSVRQNGPTVCTQLVENDAIGFLSTHLGKKSGERQTQATVQNGPGVGQTTETRHSNKSSLTSGRSNPNRKFSSSVQVTENDDEGLSRADSSSWKSGMNAIVKKCKQNEDCINSTRAKENILNDLLSQREVASIESCHAVNMLGQTDVSNTVLHISSRNSSVVSYMMGSCDQVPENITADTGQHSSEESSFSYPSQELASPLSPLPPPEVSSCSQKKGNFLLKFFKDVDPAHLFRFLFQCVFRTMSALFVYPFHSEGSGGTR